MRVAPVHVREFLLRPADRADAAKLFAFVNSPDSLAQKLNTSTSVDWDTHVAWLERRLTESDTMLLMIDNGNQIVGQVRLQRGPDGVPEIDIYVDAPWRGGGIARAAITTTIERWAERHADRSVRARVKLGNAVSLALFRSLEFEQVGASADHVTLELPIAAVSERRP